MVSFCIVFCPVLGVFEGFFLVFLVSSGVLRFPSVLGDFRPKKAPKLIKSDFSPYFRALR